MSAGKHTPGPWTSYPCNLERYSRVITANGAMVQIAYTGLNHHDQVAMTKEVYGDRRTYGPGEETTANALLIAAAPELLSALQYINETLFEGEEWECDFDETESLCCEQCDEHGCMKAKAEAARAAIQKATGSA